MQVFTRVEGFDESLVAGQVSHQAHFDLRVVGAHQRFKSVASDEGTANTHAVCAARGDVLQVRI